MLNWCGLCHVDAMCLGLCWFDVIWIDVTCFVLMCVDLS